MKYHKQQHLYVAGDKNQRGSCYPTAIACLLDLELDMVPYFHLYYFDEEDEANLRKYCADRFCDGNYESAEEYKKGNYNRFMSLALNQWDNCLVIFLASRGYKLRRMFDDESFAAWLKENPETPYLVTGNSPRGVSHIVIYKNGEMIHDPHPSNDGLVDKTEAPYQILEKL